MENRTLVEYLRNGGYKISTKVSDGMFLLKISGKVQLKVTGKVRYSR